MTRGEPGRRGMPGQRACVLPQAWPGRHQGARVSGFQPSRWANPARPQEAGPGSGAWLATSLDHHRVPATMSTTFLDSAGCRRGRRDV